MNIQKKLILYILTPLLIIFISYGVFITGHIKNAMQTAALESYDRISDIASLSVRNEMERSIGNIIFAKDFFTNKQDQTNLEMEKINSFFHSQLINDNNSHSKWIHFKKFDDTSLNHSATNSIWLKKDPYSKNVISELDIEDESIFNNFYDQIAFEKEIYISTPIISNNENGETIEVLSIFSPLLDNNGIPYGIIGGYFYFDSIIHLLSSLNESTHSFSFITDASGQVILENLNKDKVTPNKENVINQKKMIDDKRYIHTATNLTTNLGDLSWSINIVTPIDNFMDMPNNVANITVIIGSALVFIILILIILFSSSMRKRFENLFHGLQLVDEGHLDQEIEVVSNDEAGRIANTLNTMTHNLNENMVEVQLLISSLHGTSEKLAGIMCDSKKIISETDYSVKSAIKAEKSIEESIISASESIVNISISLKAIEESSNNQAVRILDYFRKIEALTDRVSEIASQVCESKKHYHKLTEASAIGENLIFEVIDTISNITKKSNLLMETNTIISEIASKIDLLSMNAAIEAAHAGDRGKGFAVVADEIRNLADHTKENSKNIDSILRSIVNGINGMAKQSTLAGNNFTEMLGYIKVITKLEETISETLKNEASENKIMLNSLTEMKRSTIEFQKEITEIFHYSANIQKINTALKESIELIKESNQLIISSNNAVTSTFQSIEDLSNDNTNHVHKVRNKINFFKLKGYSQVTLF